ncbi:MAG: hypothetical protein C5B54_00740 [Acidobacteria bacterium]|nr:MAG: hypothetical protein C5B54_00740 [Acidobacteriota bacterium]
MSSSIPSTLNFIDVLYSNSPHPDLGDACELYSWLIGDWDAQLFEHNDDGSKIERAGEWHFAWVLEGRAVQDVFIVPRRDARSLELGKEGNRYGTTLRIYDHAQEAWRITWTNPVSGKENRLIARKVGDDIVQEGKDDDGSFIRWSFRNIQENSFHWIGEKSTDQGSTWNVIVEFFCKRM